MAEPNEIAHTENAAQDVADDVSLIYKIEGNAIEVDVFELARVLDSFGNVLKEGYRVSYRGQGDLIVKVKPFEQGSFVMDLALSVQQNSGYLFLATHPELISNAKQLLEYIGFIKKIKDAGSSLLELLRGLKNGKPESVEQKGPDRYEYRATDGSIIPVNSTINALYNNPVINHFTVNIVAPAERESVDSILTYLKDDQEGSQVRIDKNDASAVRAFAEPSDSATKVEVLEDTTTKVLIPKSGNYGQTTGAWSFTIAGTKTVIKARITDYKFLTTYSSGSIRFYQGDRLKVRLLERQVTEAAKTKMQYEIVKVLNYSPAFPQVRSK